MAKVKHIVQQSHQTYAYLALLGDKSFLFSEKENAFIMYSVAGRSWVAMGDPVGPKEERSELIWRFREMCDQYDGWTVFYEVSQRNIPLYLDLGLTLLKLGEEGRVLLKDFSLEGNTRKGFRHNLTDSKRKGVRLRSFLWTLFLHISRSLRLFPMPGSRKKTPVKKGFPSDFLMRSICSIFPQVSSGKTAK